MRPRGECAQEYQRLGRVTGQNVPLDYLRPFDAPGTPPAERLTFTVDVPAPVD